MRWRHLWVAGVASALLLGGAATPEEATPQIPVVRGEFIRDFARITFEWPQSTYVDASIKGNTLTLNFDRKANPDFGKLLKQLSPYISRIDLSSDGKTVTLTLDKAHRIRSFVSGHLNGVDILGVDPKAHIKVAERMAALTPSAGEEEKAPQLPVAEKAPEAKAEPAPAPAAPPVEKTEVKAEAKPEAAPEAKAEPEKAAEKTAAPAEEKPVPKEAAAPEAAPTVSQDAAAGDVASVKVFASIGDRTVLRFAWNERVASAVFLRGDTLWIVFNKAAIFDLEPLKETANALYPAIAQTTTREASIIRISAGVYTGALVSKGREPNEWDVVMVKSPQAPPNRVRVDINTEPPLPPHVFLPMVEAAPSLALEDPDYGDTLLVVPSYQAGEGVSPRRVFVEFALLETAQGLAVRKIADATQITSVRNGLRVGTAKGAHLSTRLPPVDSKAAPEVSLPAASGAAAHDAEPKAAASGGVLFPYDAWKASADSTLINQIRNLQLAISTARDEEKASPIRLKLAQLYFAHGLNAEALGTLQEIKRTNPEFYVSSRAAAVSGGANFLMHRFTDAADDFSASELQGNPEVAYWQSMIGELLGKPDQKYDYMATRKIIQQYPPLMHQQLAIIATDRSMVRAEYNVALQILEGLKDDDMLGGIENYVEYFLAKAALETGKEEDGLYTLTELSHDHRHPLVRARAEFTLLTHALKKRAKAPAGVHAALSPEDAALVERLERLYLSWRGDNLEQETIKILGELYAEQEDYPRAMHAWRDLLSDFPGTPAAAEAMNRMRAMFVTLFDNGGISTLTPLQQLSLYYEFRSLTPPDEVGDRIVGNIADKLVSLDLLDQAINLLDYRMRYLYEKETRSRVGARLAKVYLLNRQPERALQALQASVYGENPLELRQARDHLAAQAMVDMARYNEAQQLLASDKSTEAESIRQRAWWKQKQWPKLINSVETQLKARRDASAKVTPVEAEQLLKLAVAYGAQSDTMQLQYLRDYFTPLLKESPRAKLFDYLTEPAVAATPGTFDALMQQVENTRDFLHNFTIRPELPRLPPPAAP